jgi:hypothetical protein
MSYVSSLSNTWVRKQVGAQEAQVKEHAVTSIASAMRNRLEKFNRTISVVDVAV